MRYFAGARAAAGIAEETVTLPEGATVAEALVALGAARGPGLVRVLASASFLLDEVAVRDRDTRLPDVAILDVLPPFAGG